MTKHALAAGLLAAAIGLGGCTADGSIQVGSGAGAAARADSLWANRTDWTGDNSKVIGLVRQAGFGDAGTYTIALATKAMPYQLTVNLDDPEKPVSATDFTVPATIMLGTVANLDEVRVLGGAGQFTLTKAEASTGLGYDVKLLGKDLSALRSYVASAED
ncbi:MAG: DUF4825 domain-containing protein [Terracoccus sp.]